MILTRRGWLVVILVGALSAGVSWGAIQVGQHLWQDHQDHHLVLELLKYNIAQGKLLQLPVGPPPAPPAVPETK